MTLIRAGLLGVGYALAFVGLAAWVLIGGLLIAIELHVSWTCGALLTGVVPAGGLYAISKARKAWRARR